MAPEEKSALSIGDKTDLALSISPPSKRDQLKQIQGYLGFHIADVRRHILPHSATDKQIHEEVFSAETEDLLPEQIKADINFGPEARPAISVSVPLMKNYEIGEARVTQEQVRLHKMLSYKEFDAALRSTSEESPFIETLHRVAQKLLLRRKQHGALSIFYDFQQEGHMTTEEGHVVVIEDSKMFMGYLVKREFSLLLNELLSSWAHTSNVPILYRGQQAPATAEQRELLRSIERAFLAPSRRHVPQLMEHLHKELGPAYYAAQPQFHFGLHTKPYAHLSHPAHHYPDYVSIQNISAALEKAPLPFDLQQMETFVKTINGVIFDAVTIQPQEQEEGASPTHEELPETHQEASYKPGTLYAKLRQMGHQSAFTQEHLSLVQQGAAQMEGLEPREISQVLFMFTKVTEELQEAKEICLEYLCRVPHHSRSVLMNWSQVEKVTIPEIKGQPSGSGTFHCNSHVQFQTRKTTISTKGASKREAEQRAYIAYLFFIHEKPLPNWEAPTGVVSKLSGQPNMLGTLNELCTQRKWPLPVYTVLKMEGRQHTPTFVMEGRITTKENVFVAEASGKTKQDTKEKIAFYLMQQIPKVPVKLSLKSPPEKSPTELAQLPFSLYEVDGVYVINNHTSRRSPAREVITTYCQKFAELPPVITWEEGQQAGQKAYFCKIRIELGNTVLESSVGVGHSKDTAADNAAKPLIPQLPKATFITQKVVKKNIAVQQNGEWTSLDLHTSFKNYKGELNNICQKKSWKMSFYDAHPLAAKGGKIVQVTLGVDTPFGTLEATGYGQKRADAEQNAARVWLEENPQ